MCSYVVPRYMSGEEALPPYCTRNNNISIALTENATDPEYFKNCIRRVEVCQCTNENHCYNCTMQEQNYDGRNIRYTEMLENATTLLRLTYHRQDPNKQRTNIHTVKYLKL